MALQKIKTKYLTPFQTCCCMVRVQVIIPLCQTLVYKFNLICHSYFFCVLESDNSLEPEERVKDMSQLYQIFPDEVLGSGQFGIVYGGTILKM